MNESRKYLETCLKLYAQSWPPEVVEQSPMAYILRNGTGWTAAQLPEEIEQGEPKLCYVNAYKLALSNPGRFFYVEGYATAVIPVEHAWCVDRQGRVIDRTPHWEKGSDYFGVKFTLNELHAIQRITQGYGALCHWQHWEDVRELLTRRAQPFRARAKTLRRRTALR